MFVVYIRRMYTELGSITKASYFRKGEKNFLVPYKWSNELGFSLFYRHQNRAVKLYDLRF